MGSRCLPACREDADSDTSHVHGAACSVEAEATDDIQNKRPSSLDTSSRLNSRRTTRGEACTSTFNSTTASPARKLRLIMQLFFQLIR